MNEAWIEKLKDPVHLRAGFYLIEIFSGIIFILILFLARNRSPESGFSTRESDPKRLKKEAIDKKPPKQARIGGFSIHGAPHEILGIPLNSSIKEIHIAYRDLMKRYHPDKVARPGSQAWEDAQKIASAINTAKVEMLKGKSKS